jgi:hypothetical protein
MSVSPTLLLTIYIWQIYETHPSHCVFSYILSWNIL